MQIQLVYMSAATRPFDAFELAVLLAKSRQKNASLNISGMLLYHDGSFLQVLEGAEKSVETLYERIRQDERHTDCERLLKCYIDRRSFEGWSMGFVNSDMVDLKILPGYNDFFGRSFSRKAFGAQPSAPHKLLLAFREGQWRQTVEVESELATVE